MGDIVMNRSVGNVGVLLLGVVFVCSSSYADRSLNTPLKLKFAVAGHSVSTTTLEPHFVIHVESLEEETKESQGEMMEFRRDSENVYIHIEGEIGNDRGRKVYTIELQGKIELSSHSEKSNGLRANQADVPDANESKSSHEEFNMELRASTWFKVGQKKTLASKEGLDVELRIEEDD